MPSAGRNHWLPSVVATYEQREPGFPSFPLPVGAADLPASAFARPRRRPRPAHRRRAPLPLRQARPLRDRFPRRSRGLRQDLPARAQEKTDLGASGTRRSGLWYGRQRLLRTGPRLPHRRFRRHHLQIHEEHLWQDRLLAAPRRLRSPRTADIQLAWPRRLPTRRCDHANPL